MCFVVDKRWCTLFVTPLATLCAVEPLVDAIERLTRPDPTAAAQPPQGGLQGGLQGVGGAVVLMTYEHRTYPDFDPRVRALP